MPIEVIAKIEPKNSAFVVVVDAENSGVTTSGFTGVLTAADSTVQKAFDTIDALLYADTGVLGNSATTIPSSLTVYNAINASSVTVSAPLSISGQHVSIVNDAAETVTEVDTGTLSNSSTTIPSSSTVFNAIGSVGGGDVSGLQVTIKDATNLYVWGGKIRINDVIYQADAQITFNVATAEAATLYHLYVNAPVSGYILSSTELNLSTAGFEVGSTPHLPPYDHSKGARYFSGDGTKRWLVNIKTA